MVDVPTHLLIAAALVGLYAVDCIVLLDGNYLLYRCGSEGRPFEVASPGRVTVVRERIVYVLPLLSPWIPLRRASITPLPLQLESKGGPGLIAVLLSLAMTLTHAIAIAAIVLMGANSQILLCALSAIYLSSLAFSLFAAFRIHSVRLSHAVVGVVCPPNALNLLRRAEMDRQAVNFRSTFNNCFSSKERQAAREQLAPLLIALPDDDREALLATTDITEQPHP